jgi:hypothetical protein
MRGRYLEDGLVSRVAGAATAPSQELRILNNPHLPIRNAQFFRTLIDADPATPVRECVILNGLSGPIDSATAELLIKAAATTFPGAPIGVLAGDDGDVTLVHATVEREAVAVAAALVRHCAVWDESMPIRVRVGEQPFAVTLTWVGTAFEVLLS